MKKLLITCADDFGLTQGVNNGIVDCYKNGILRSTSILANAPEFSHSLRLSKQHPGMDVGVHLFLTEFRPVNYESDGLLTDKNGRFLSSYLSVLKQLFFSPELYEKVREEFKCQIEFVLSKGIVLSHINSHKHIHAYPGIWEIVQDLANIYNIPVVRYPVEKILKYRRKISQVFFKRNLKTQVSYMGFSCLARYWYRGNSPLCSRSGVNDFFGMYDTGYLDEEVVLDFLKRLEPGVTEMMCHPGYVDDDLLSLPTRLTTSREREVRALCHPRVKAYIRENHIEVISFHECR